MKPAVLLTLSFLLFAFITNLPLTFSQGAEQVLDINGNPIFPAGRYYIVPAIFGPTGGGVRLGVTGNSTCPVTVLQDLSEVNFGLAVKFSIPDIGPGIIFTGTALDIEFVYKPECATSSKWVVVVDDSPKEWVGIGGAEDHPGKQIITGTFNIQKHIEGYKLVFCPKTTAPPNACSEIERSEYYDEKGRRLILTNDSFYNVVFIDAVATGRSTN